jgi:NCAIR mutase (PurE)-related protein
MKKEAYVDLGFACVDTGRQTRRGFPEVIFCQRKTKDEILRIARELGRDPDAPLLLTRLEPRVYSFLKSRLKGLSYNRKARRLSVKGVVQHPLPQVMFLS